MHHENAVYRGRSLNLPSLLDPKRSDVMKGSRFVVRIHVRTLVGIRRFARIVLIVHQGQPVNTDVASLSLSGITVAHSFRQRLMQ